MKELLVEYRQTLTETRMLLANLEKKIKIAKSIKNNKALHILIKLQEDKVVINSWISNLQYSIQWLNTGRRPRSTRGIERRSVYQKEILTDASEIAKIIESEQSFYIDEINMESEEEEEYFEQVTNSILEILTEKESQIFKMHISGLAPFEIAGYMQMPYKTVYKSIKRCKEKISNEDVSFL